MVTLRPKSRLTARDRASELATRLAGWLQILWRKVCPWYPGEFPELDARNAPPRRPPNSRRHRFGRRDEVEQGEAVAGAVEHSPLVILVLPSASVKAERR